MRRVSTICGDLNYGNFSPSYPSVKYLTSDVTETNFHTSLTTFMTNNPLQYRLINTDANLSSSLNIVDSTIYPMVIWSPNGDTIDDRFLFQFSHLGSNSIYEDAMVTMYNDSGCVVTNLVNPFDQDVNREGYMSISLDQTNERVNYTTGDWELTNRVNYSDICMFATADSNNLAVVWYQKNLVTGDIRMELWYAGELTTINTQSNYYSDPSFLRRRRVLGTRLRSTGEAFFKHFIRNEIRLTHRGGEAEYSINCTDATPLSENLTSNLLLFDSNPELDYPAFGKTSNIFLISYGMDIEIGDMIEISGGMPDGGSPNYFCLGTHIDKKILMRVYKS